MNHVEHTEGRVVRVAGPVIGVLGLESARLYDVVRIGALGLVGEIIQINSDEIMVQVYEETSGVRVGEPVQETGHPLVAMLGPGLLGRVYDGLQRPLVDLARQSGEFIQRGVNAAPLPEDIRWRFIPLTRPGDRLGPGDVIGEVKETQTITHRILVPAGVSGKLVHVAGGDLRVTDTAAVLEPGNGHKPVNLTLSQRWPIRHPRPVHSRIEAQQPLITGTRIIDAFFPIARGGAAIIPGGFGTGKTVLQHTLARWADADIVVYVGCGERGNEMAEVLDEFPTLEDPRTGRPLMERTVLIANTSNMPVAAREASIYMGITIAEYYRDMGLDVLMLADSTSRWGEALREISGRLEELPGEEGYPAYLSTRLSEFYERAGSVFCLGGGSARTGENRRRGAVSIVGAISPPGADFSEPITQSAMRVTGTFWALDYDLSRRRHFPSINWTSSYSLYDLRRWFGEHVDPQWSPMVDEAVALLQREVELLEIVQLVGPDSLPDSDRAALAAAQMLREDFLQQSSYHPVDRFCTLEKTFLMLRAIMTFHHCAQDALQKGVSLGQVVEQPVLQELARMKELPVDQAAGAIRELVDRIQLSFADIGAAVYD